MAISIIMYFFFFHVFVNYVRFFDTDYPIGDVEYVPKDGDISVYVYLFQLRFKPFLISLNFTRPTNLLVEITAIVGN